MKDYVVFYGPTDGASGYELRNAEKVIQSFNADTEYTDINRVIELYNIKQYFDNEMYLTSWNELTKNKYIFNKDSKLLNNRIKLSYQRDRQKFCVKVNKYFQSDETQEGEEN